MREPKKVHLGNVPKGPSRADLKRAADLELWKSLNKFGMIAKGPISSGSASVDARIKTRIGGYQADSKINVWHGYTNGEMNFLEEQEKNE